MENRVLHISLDGFTRQKYINELSFFYDQARERLQPIFADLNDIYNSTAQRLFDEESRKPGTGDECLGDVADNAETQALTYTFLLERMRMDILLTLIASIYHQWEKQLAFWFVNELTLNLMDEKRAKIFWHKKFCERMKILEAGGWELNGTEVLSILNEHRLLVNAYKHGEGPSFQNLKKEHPELLIEHLLRNEEDIDPRLPFNVTLDDLERFLSNLVRFWQEVPAVLSWPVKIND